MSVTRSRDRALLVSMRTLIMALSVALTLAMPASAADDPADDAILVLDASGSMWGQIDGVNKIVIAKDVVEELTYKLPTGRRLGLVAYGHRRQGDCKDIETLAPVGAERSRLREQIRALTPRGKTPLSASVQHAAETLDYTKNRATVILVSDGKETCDFDPCELGRILEKNGLDFTVHVIGFDVTVEERTGLQCLAAATGGQFLAADDAAELAQALDEVAVGTAIPTAPQTSEPNPVQLALKATILDGGPLIQSQLDWTVTPRGGGAPAFSATDAGVAETELPPGDYRVQVVWHGWQHGGEKTGGRDISLAPQQVDVVTVPIDLALPVTLQAPQQAGEGEVIEVTWEGPDHLSAQVNIAEIESSPLDSIFFFNPGQARSKAKAAATGPATWTLHTPPIPGDYELRYTLRDPPVILARRPITLTDLEYHLRAPAEAPISTPVTVHWEGDRHPKDFLTLIAKGSGKTFDNGRTARLRDDGTAEITTPPEPGDYEIRYVMHTAYNSNLAYQHQVQASVDITVTAVEATLQAPEVAEGGSTIEVEWTGPAGAEDDFISVVTPGAAKYSRDSWARLYSRAGAPQHPAPIRVPAIAGEYELVYVVEPGGAIVARRPLRIEASRATLSAPATVQTGAAIEVQYTGSAFKGDRIVLVAADRADSKMWSVTGNYGFWPESGGGTGTIPARLTAEPGAYEVRYVTGLQHQVLARQAITVTE